MSKGSIAMIGLAFSLLCGGLGLGCGSNSSSKSNNSDSGTSSATALASCHAYCDALIAKQCAFPVYANLLECQTDGCGPIESAPTQCQAAQKVYFDCEKNQADICADNGCASEYDATGTCL